MKVSLTTRLCSKGNYSVELTQGNQNFKLDYEGSKEEAEWYAKMFRKAIQNLLKEHDSKKLD